MQKDEILESINDIIKSEKVTGSCSFCKEEVKPVAVIGGLTKRDLSFCSNPKCNQPLVVCLAPGCDNYANGSIMRRPLCHWCFEKATPNVGSAIVKVGAAVTTTAAGLYIKKKLSDN